MWLSVLGQNYLATMKRICRFGPLACRLGRLATLRPSQRGQHSLLVGGLVDLVGQLPLLHGEARVALRQHTPRALIIELGHDRQPVTVAEGVQFKLLLGQSRFGGCSPE